MDKNHFFRGVSFFAVVLAFVVVVLGAYTRLTDAGLGCPDWPGCYGHWVVSSGVEAPVKAWTEMVHRYAAGALGLLILLLAVFSFAKKRGRTVSLLLILLVLFQAALGRWTVTLQLLPVVVMGHLLGGFAILSLLWLLFLQISPQEAINGQDKRFRFWAILGLIILILQITLGGWTSANYAALACPDFPLCQGQWFSPFQSLHTAFNVFMPVGVNFEGGYLDGTARVTIQMMHRLGALVTAIYLGILSVWLLCGAKTPSFKKLGAMLLLLLVLQLFLGAMNVLLMLPLGIAVMHNAVAAVLLITLVTAVHGLYESRF